MMISPVFAADPASTGDTAVLIEGTVRTEGLPGFSANRISALFGRYQSAGQAPVLVWVTSESLFFNPDAWVAKKAGLYACYYTVSSENRQIWIVQRTITMRKELSDRTKWSFIASFERLVPEEYCARFIDAYIKRTEFFFSSAKRADDLSFPATLKVNLLSAD